VPVVGKKQNKHHRLCYLRWRVLKIQP